MAYAIQIAEPAIEELAEIRVFDRRRIVDAIRVQLENTPTVPTRNRKCLGSVVPAFKHSPPVWELRVGDHRVFYDVDETAMTVIVRAVRHKRPDQTTEEIIQ